jgi:hypothetical protein
MGPAGIHRSNHGPSPESWKSCWMMFFHMTNTGWWFGLSIIYGLSSFPLTNSYFSIWLKPPTRIDDKSDNDLEIQYWLIWLRISKGQSFNWRKQQEGDGLWEWLPSRILGNGPNGFMAEDVLDKSWSSDIYPKKD